jgi:hypothetical protein
VVLQGATIANVARSVGNEDKQFGQAVVLPARLTEVWMKTTWVAQWGGKLSDQETVPPGQPGVGQVQSRKPELLVRLPVGPQ